MASEETTAQARTLRSQALVARATLAERGPGWSDYERILEIVVDMEAEAKELERPEITTKPVSGSSGHSGLLRLSASDDAEALSMERRGSESKAS